MSNTNRPTNMPHSADPWECFVVNCCAAFVDPPFQIISHRLVCGPAVELGSAVRASSAAATDRPPADFAVVSGHRPSLSLHEERPNFDKETCELWFRGNLVCSFARRAKNCLAVLKAFQEVGWRARIDDPLPGGKDAERLGNTICTLNAKQNAIKFFAGGDGKSFCWKVKN